MMDLSLRELEYVAAIDDERNVTRAAERVHVAQQALSQALQRIERKLGVRLFDRTSRRVVPTPAGETLAAEAREILASVHRAVRLTRAAAGSPESLRVHVSEPSLLTPRRVLAAVRAHVPQAVVHQTTLPQLAVRDQLLSGALSFAIAGRVRAPGLEGCLLRDEHVGALVGAGHPLAAADSVTVAEVARYPMLSIDEAMSGWNRWVSRLVGEQGETPTWTRESVFGIGSGADILDDARTVLLTLESVSKEHLDRLVWRPLAPATTVPWFLTWSAERAQDSLAMGAAIEVARRLAADQRWVAGP